MKTETFQSQRAKGDLQGKDTENEAQKLFNLLFIRPLSRRMAATELGHPDQTYMVTQIIYDWLKLGRAQIVGQIKCKRSDRMVEAVSTNQKLFKSTSNQLNLF